jgi:hypothetical protein
MRRIGAASVVLALVAASGAAPVTPATATTPGSNGLLAFVRATSDCHDIYLVRSDGGTTKLSKCPRVIGAPAWSPDAKRLAVSYLGPSGGRNPKLGMLKATGGSITVLDTGVGTSNSPVFSRDGAVLAFAGGDGGDDNLAIYTVPVGGGNATKLVGGAANGQANDEPDWSPAADVIAWAHKDAMSQTFDVWTMTVDVSGQNPTAMSDLTNGQGSSRYPSWSPDGTKLAFASDRSGSWQIYVMDADGSNVVQLTSSGNHTQPAWSPDGKQIVYTTGCTTAACATSGPNGHRQNGDLQVIDVTDLTNPGAPRTLLHMAAGEFDAQWAPACSGSGCPVTAIRPRTVRLTSIHRGTAKGRVVGSDAPRECRAHVPVVLQYENAIDLGDYSPYPDRHWVKEGKGRTTSTGRFRLHLPPRQTGWYRVKATKQRSGSQVCAVAASRLRVNYFIRDPRGDNVGPLDIAWADASLHHHVVTFTVHAFTSFATRQKSTPCILFMKRMRDSHYNGSICFGGLAIHDELRHLTVKRPNSKTIVYTFKESELDPGFTNFEWGVRSGVSDHDLYDILPSDFELGNPHPVFGAADTPYFFKHKPTYGHG